MTDKRTDICDCRVAFVTEKHNLIVLIEIMIHILLKLNENNLFEAATFSRRISSTMKQRDYILVKLKLKPFNPTLSGM